MIQCSLEGFIPGDFATQLGEAAIGEMLDGVAASARAKWVSLATDKLTSTRQTYIKGIQPVQIAPEDGLGQGRIITLVGALANALEAGQESYDMHNTLLGPNVPVVPRGKGLKGKHEKKGGGFYRVIPFRHQTPDSEGIFGTPLGKAYEEVMSPAEAAALGQKIYALAKALAPSKGMPGGKITYGGRLPAGAAGVKKLRPHHSTDIYASMIKQSKEYEQATGSQYATFRVISDASRGVKWIRKATPGIKIAEQVQQFIENDVIRQAFEAMLEGASE